MLVFLIILLKNGNFFLKERTIKLNPKKKKKALIKNKFNNIKIQCYYSKFKMNNKESIQSIKIKNN